MSWCILEVLGVCPCTLPGDPTVPVQKLCKKAIIEPCGCEGVRSLFRNSEVASHSWVGKNCALGCSRVIGSSLR